MDSQNKRPTLDELYHKSQNTFQADTRSGEEHQADILQFLRENLSEEKYLAAEKMLSDYNVTLIDESHEEGFNEGKEHASQTLFLLDPNRRKMIWDLIARKVHMKHEERTLKRRSEMIDINKRLTQIFISDLISVSNFNEYSHIKYSEL